MAIVQASVGGRRLYLGLASDTKPTGATVAGGSQFYETDSKVTYIYDGSSWSIYQTGGGGGGGTVNADFGNAPTGVVPDTGGVGNLGYLGSILTAIGRAADAAVAAGATGSLKAMFRRLTTDIDAIKTSLAGTLTVATHAVTQSGAWNITNVSGTVSLPTGASTAAKQPALGTAGTSSADVLSVQGVASGTPQPISADTLPLPTGAATNDALVSILTELSQKLEPGDSIAPQQIIATTATLSNVSASATSVQLFAANTSRVLATVVNDADKVLRAKSGATASATSYSKILGKKDADGIGGQWDVDASYTGRVDGIWDTGPTGSARLTEYT